MTARRHLVAGALLAALAVAGAPAAAQTQAKTASDPLEQALLEGLPPRAAPSAQPPGGARPPAPDKAAPPAAEAPPAKGQPALRPIADRMVRVAERLARGDVALPTQQEQQQILRELDALLAQSRQPAETSAAQQAGAAPNSTNPAAGGEPAPGTTGETTQPAAVAPPPAASLPELISRVWGHLPAKVREQMRAALGEEFLPQYEPTIEAYYRRLAEERPPAP